MYAMRRWLILAALFVLGVLVAAAPADSSPSGEVVAAALNNSSLPDEVVAATPNDSSLSGATVNEPLCGVSDDTALLAAAVRTEAGHMSHQEWLANGRAQEDVGRINDVVDAITPGLAVAEVTVDYDPLALQLADGVIGVTWDNVKQLFLVVVDPVVIAMYEFQRDLSAVSGELNVEVRAGCHSIEEITAARHVLKGRNWHPQASKATYGFYLDPATAAFNVTLAEADREVGNALSEALGDLVDVAYGEPSRRGRLNDGAPHYGGAGIGSPSNNNFCTSGFTIIKNGVRGSVSAGHCFNNGNSVYSGPEYYGYATGQPPFPMFDMIRITSVVTSYTNKIHVDPCCPSVRTVVSHGNAILGQQICVSGMVTRAVCGLVVISLYSDFCDAAGCTVSLGVAEDLSRVVGQGGDSGAPMYNRLSNNTAMIRGMEVAGTAPTNVYFHHIFWMEAVLGMSVALN